MKRILALLLTLTLFYGLSKFDLTPQKNTTCPFCEIREQQLILRGTTASIIRTHKPSVPGHILIIPNRHVETFDGLTSEELHEMTTLIQDHHHDQYLLIQKNGPLAGQSVSHVHIHLIPRTPDISTPSFILRFLIAPFLKPVF